MSPSLQYCLLVSTVSLSRGSIVIEFGFEWVIFVLVKIEWFPPPLSRLKADNSPMEREREKTNTKKNSTIVCTYLLVWTGPTATSRQSGLNTEHADATLVQTQNPSKNGVLNHTWFKFSQCCSSFNVLQLVQQVTTTFTVWDGRILSYSLAYTRLSPDPRHGQQTESKIKVMEISTSCQGNAPTS